MMECIPSNQESEGCQLTGGVQPYIKLEELVGWSGAGEQGLQHANDQRDPEKKNGKPKFLKRLLDLPK